MQFLNSAASLVINRLLGDYVSNVDTQNVSFSLSGMLTLHQLQLKSTALDKLGLPIKVRSGSISKLHLQVPLRSSTPAVIEIEDLYILACPASRSADDYNEVEAEESSQRSKQRKLALAESYKQARQQTEVKKESEDDGFVQRLLKSVLSTLQVSIKRVHFRYEDSGIGTTEQQQSFTSLHYAPPFAAGIILESLEAKSTDSQWNISETSSSVLETILYKLVALKSLSAYVDLGDRSVLEECGHVGIGTATNPDFSMFSTIMKNSMDARCDKSMHNYILSPVNGALRVTLNKKNNNFDFPKVSVQLILERIFLSVRPEQYHSIMFLLTRLEYASAATQNLKWKPKERPTENPRLWWRYVLRSVLHPIQQRNKLLTPEYFTSRRQHREEYVPIYAKVVNKKSLAASEKQSLETLEKALNFEEIMFFRTLAEIEAKRDKEAKSNPTAPTPSQGWGGWLGSFVWGSSTSPAVAGSEQQAPEAQPSTSSRDSVWDSIQLSEEQENALLDAVNFDRAKDNEKSKAPEGYEKYVFSSNAEIGHLTLMDSISTKLVSFGFNQFNVDARVKRHQTVVNLTLGALNLDDHCSPNTLYPRLLYPQTVSNEHLLNFQLVYNSSNGPETNQIEKKSDIEISLQLRRLNLVCNVELATRVTQVYWKQLMAISSSAPQNPESDPSSTYKKTKSWAQSEKRNEQLLSLASMRKSVHLDIQVNAPNIVIPHSCSDPSSPLFALALGTFRFTTGSDGLMHISDPAKTVAISETNSLRPEFYTLHRLTVSDIYAVVTTSERFRTSLDMSSFVEDENLVSPISATVFVAACKINSETLPKLRITSSISAIQCRLPTIQLKTVLHIANYISSNLATMLGTSPTSQSSEPTSRKSWRSSSPKSSPVGMGTNAENPSSSSQSIDDVFDSQELVPLSPQQDPNWSSALQYTELLVEVSASAGEDQSSSQPLGIGVSFETSAPEISLVLLFEDKLEKSEIPLIPSSSSTTQFELSLSSIAYSLETYPHSLKTMSKLGAVKVTATKPSPETPNSAVTTTLVDSVMGTAHGDALASREASLISFELVHRKKSDKSYENVDSDGVFHFHQLLVNLHSLLLKELMNYVRDISDVMKSSDQKIPTQSIETTSESVPITPRAVEAISSTKNRDRIEFRLKVICEAVQVAFFDLDLLPLSKCALRGADSTFSIIANQGILLTASISEISVLDASTEMNMVSAKSSENVASPIYVEFTTIQPSPESLKASFPSGKIPTITTATVILSSIRVHLHAKWLFNMLLSIVELGQSFSEPFANDLPEISESEPLPPSLPQISVTPESKEVSKAPTTNSLFKYHVEVLDTKLGIPEDSRLQSFVFVDVGSISVDSDVVEEAVDDRYLLQESIKVALDGFQLSVGSEDAASSRRQILVPSTSINVSIGSTSIDQKYNLIQVDIPNIALSLSPSQAKLLFTSLQNNLFYMPTEKEKTRRISQAVTAEKQALKLNPQLYATVVFDEVSRTLKAQYDVSIGRLSFEMADSTVETQPVRLIALVLSTFASSVSMYSDDSLDVEFRANKLSANDLRPVSVLPPEHPMVLHPEMDCEDELRLIVFPTTSKEAQLVGKFSTVPSKNQMTVDVVLCDFQLLPEASILNKLLLVQKPIIDAMLALLNHRESIMTLTMTPLQKAKFLRLKTHPDTCATYNISLIRPDIIVARKNAIFNGLKFISTSPAMIEIKYSQTPSNTLTLATIKQLAICYGATTETHRAKLFQISKTAGSSTPTPAVDDFDIPTASFYYDILSPITVHANILMTEKEHQYALQFMDPFRICASYLDYLDIMEILEPFSAATDLDGEDSESESFGTPSLLYDPSPIRPYPPAQIDSIESTNSLLSSLSGGGIMAGSAFKPSKEKEDDTEGEEVLHVDDLYDRISQAVLNPPDEVLMDSRHLSGDGMKLPSFDQASSSASASSSSISPATNRSTQSVPAPGSRRSRTSHATPPSFNPDLSAPKPPTTTQSTKYIPKRLNVGRLKMELMVMDNLQSDLGLVRLSLELTTLMLQNWDVESYLASLKNPRMKMAEKNSLPKRLAEIEFDTQAESFTPMLSVWEPLISPCSFQIRLAGRMLNIVSQYPIDLMLTENFISSYQRIVGSLDVSLESREERASGNSLSSSSILSASNSSIGHTTNAGSRGRGTHMNYISNNTGNPVRYFLVQEGTLRQSSERVLDPGCEEPLLVPLAWYSELDMAANILFNKADRAEIAKRRLEFTITVISAGTPVQNISINKMGCRVTNLDDKRMLVVDVQYKHGAKVVMLKSRISIHNNTNAPLVIGLELSSRDASAPGSARSTSSVPPPRSSTLLPAPSTSKSPSRNNSRNFNGQVSEASVSPNLIAAVSQLCVVEPFGWYHVPIDLIHDGILRFRPGIHNEVYSTGNDPSPPFTSAGSSPFYSNTQSSSIPSAESAYAYHWSDYRCNLRTLLPFVPRYATCIPQSNVDLASSTSLASSNILMNSAASNMLNSFQYSMGVCRVATKSSIIAGSDELVLHFQPPLVIENLLPFAAEYLLHETEPIRPQKVQNRNSKYSAQPEESSFVSIPTVGKIGTGQRIAYHQLSPLRPLHLGLCAEGYDWSFEALIRAPEPAGPRFIPQERLEAENRRMGLPNFLLLPETKPSGKNAGNGHVDNVRRTTKILIENQVTEYGTRLVSFYCQYWVVNKTGIPLLAASDPKDLATIGACMQARLLPQPPEDDVSVSKFTLAVPHMNPVPFLGNAKETKTEISITRVKLPSLFNRDYSTGCVDPSTLKSSSLASSSGSLSSSSASLSRKSSLATIGAPKIQITDPKHLPFIYAPDGEEDTKKLFVKVQGSRWSVPLALASAANGISRVTVTGEPLEGALYRKIYDLSLSVGVGADRFWRTTVLTFAPRYMFTNKLSVPLLIRCNATINEGILQPGETAPWHWLWHTNNEKLTGEEIQICLDIPSERKDSPLSSGDNTITMAANADRRTSACSWSGSMLLESGVMMTVAMFNDVTKERYFVRVMPRLHADTGITTIIFKQEDFETPLFKIINKTSQTITITQAGIKSAHYPCAADTIPPFDSRIWGWYTPMAIDKGVEILVGSNRIPKTYSMTKVRRYPRMTVKMGSTEFSIGITIDTEKTTRVLKIEPYTQPQPKSSLNTDSPQMALKARGMGTKSPSKPLTRVRHSTHDGPPPALSTTSSSASIASSSTSGASPSKDANKTDPRFSSTAASSQPDYITDFEKSTSIDSERDERSSVDSGREQSNLLSTPSKSTLTRGEDYEEDTSNDPDWQIGLALLAVTVSVINKEPEEIAFGVVSRIAFEMVLYPKRKTMELQIEDMQVDNSDPMTFYPVAICTGPGSSPRYWLHFSLIRSTEYPDIIFQPLISLLAKETHVRVDEVLLLKLLDLYNARRPSAHHSTHSHVAVKQEVNLLTTNDNVLLLGVNEDASKMIYSELVLLNPILVLLSFQFTKGTTDDAREQEMLENSILKSACYRPSSIDGIGVQRDLPSLYGFLTNRLTGALTFERAPLFINCLIVENSFVSSNVFYETALSHYTSQIVKFGMSVGGSLEIIGDPIALGYNIGSGFKDLFYEPAKGIAISPLAFGAGLGRGGAKFAKKSIYGIFNTLNKGFNSVGTLASKASFDTDYQAKRAQRKQREQPQNVAYGVGQGFLELGKGLFDGITGLVVKPVKGAQKDGALGFFKGVGQGAAGVVVKPVVGVFDLAQRTTEGIKNTAGDAVRTQRTRWPMFIAEDSIIRAYDPTLSLAMRMLHSVKRERFAHEDFWGHFVCQLTTDTKQSQLLGLILLASSQRLILALTYPSTEMVPSSSHKSLPYATQPDTDVKWHIPFESILRTEKQFQEPATGTFHITRREYNRKCSFMVNGPRTRLDELEQWIRDLCAKHSLLASFFRQNNSSVDKK